jgi:hypothetical protein
VSATAWPSGDWGVWNVRAEAVVEQPRDEAPWPAADLDVDVNGKTAGTLHLEGKSGVWLGTVSDEPKTIELDAPYDVMRRIADADLPMCLNTTLAAGAGRIEWRDALPDFDAIAHRLAGEKGFSLHGPDDTGPDLGPMFPTPRVRLKVLRIGSSVTIAGHDGKPPLVANDAAFEIGGKRYTNPNASVLCSGVENGKPVTWFLALSEGAASRAKMLGFYGWDQYVVFESGQRKPVARGFLDRNPTATRRAIVIGDDSARAIFGTVRRLSSDAFGGRRPGTEGHEKAERFLEGELLALTATASGDVADIRTVQFPLGVPELESPRDLILTTDAGVEVLHDAFRPLAGSPERDAGKPFPFAEGAGAVPLPGKWPDTTPDGLARLWRQLDTSSTPAILLAPTPATRVGLAPFLDTPKSLTSESEAELAKPGPDGKPLPRPSIAEWIADRRLRAFAAASPLRIPYLVLSDATIDRIDNGPPIKTIDFAIRWSADAAAAGNGGVTIVADIEPPTAPAVRPRVVVVHASAGSIGDGDSSGVAAILEAIRGLPEQVYAGKTKLGLLVICSDGSARSPVGSRRLANQLAKDYDVRAVVNLGAVGRVTNDTVHVVGLSTPTDLGKKAADALTAAGLTVGPDIDKDAYAEGGDHWPFHTFGIPSITISASDSSLVDSTANKPEFVDPVGVARVAHAVRTLLDRLLSE